MKRLWPLLAIAPIAVLALQDDDDLQRQAKLALVADWVGQWDASVTLSGPPEIASQTGHGTLDVKWDLDKTALRFDGSLRFAAATQGTPPIKVTGLLTFNQAATYPQRGYTGMFSWSPDGRMLQISGDFQDKNLTLNAHVFPGADSNMIVKVIPGKTRRVTVSIPGPNGSKPEDWITIDLTKR